ncbi:MAG: triose-phosphate isomerase [Candidatus Andersenbacteria bacterium]
MTKQKLVVGNWKMELSNKATAEITRAMKNLAAGQKFKAQVVVCPSYPDLLTVSTALKGTGIEIGAQNIHGEERGPYTGQVSVVQIQSYVQWCIVGHSEVRAQTGEDDAAVTAKAQLLFAHNITPIVCIGETAEERDGEQTVEKITHQVQTLLATIPRTSFTKMVIAYEPIWAIGTGVTPEPIQVSEIVLLIRKLIAGRFDKAAADRVHMLYGGSVTADNIGQYVTEPGVDGVLVGGASTHPRDFFRIIEVVQSPT